MALWKDPSKANQTDDPQPSPAARFDMPSLTEPKSQAPASATISASTNTKTQEHPRKESVIAPDIAIEGKIEGAGHVRIAGQFKGDIDVRGDLTIEANAKVNGGIRAEKIMIAGELTGNVDSAANVELMPGGAVTGDVKAASMVVAAGARMRGHVDFGWEDSKPAAPGNKRTNGGEANHGNGA